MQPSLRLDAEEGRIVRHDELVFFCTPMVSLKLPVAVFFLRSGTPTFSACACAGV